MQSDNQLTFKTKNMIYVYLESFKKVLIHLLDILQVRHKWSTVKENGMYRISETTKKHAV